MLKNINKICYLQPVYPIKEKYLILYSGVAKRNRLWDGEKINLQTSAKRFSNRQGAK